jgi:hypothetical protein
LRTSSSAATLRSRRCSDVIEFALELLLLVGADKEELLAGTGGGNRLSLPRLAKFIGEESEMARLWRDRSKLWLLPLVWTDL